MKMLMRFESFVNSEEYQTKKMFYHLTIRFESFVNSEEYQTHIRGEERYALSLRALLIQKSIKHIPTVPHGLTWFESFVNSKVV